MSDTRLSGWIRRVSPSVRHQVKWMCEESVPLYLTPGFRAMGEDGVPLYPTSTEGNG